MNDKIKLYVIKKIIDDKRLSTKDKIEILNDMFTKYEDKIIIKRIYEPYPYPTIEPTPIYPQPIFTTTSNSIDLDMSCGTALQPDFRFNINDSN